MWAFLKSLIESDINVQGSARRADLLLMMIILVRIIDDYHPAAGVR